MIKSFFCIFLMSFILTACSSLEGEYSKITDDIHALEQEAKALSGVEYSISDNVGNYVEKKNTLLQLRAKHKSQGLAVGPNIPDGLEPEEEVTVLRENNSTVSDKISSLKRRRREIVHKQEGLSKK